MRKSIPVTLFLTVAMAAATDLSAQEGLITGVVVAVEEEDGTPKQGVTGTLVTGGRSTPLGTTNAGGTMTIPYTTTLPAGTKMDAAWISGASGSALLLYPEGEIPPQCEEAEATPTEDDDCDRVGAFIWGETAAIDMVVGGGGTPGFRITNGAGRYSLGTITTGITINANYFWDFTDVLGDQPNLVDAEGDEFPFGVGGFVEAGLGNRWYVGTGFRYNQHSIDQVYAPSDPLLPQRVSGSVDAFFVDFYGGPRFPVRTSIISLGFGATVAVNRLDFDSEYLGGTETGSRTHTGWKGRFGGSVLLPVGDRFYARASADLTHSLEGGDADAHGRFGLGIAYTF